MKFTSKDIECKQLRNFLRTRVHSNKTKIIDKYLFNVYDTNSVIKLLQNKIKENKNNPNHSRFIPTWEKHINTLKRMSS